MRQPISKRQRAIEIARVLRVEISEISELDPATRRDMIGAIDDLIAGLQEA